jgi:hypothetical protein
VLQGFSRVLAFIFVIFPTLPAQAQNSAATGDEFLGKWENIQPSHPGYSLSRHGNTFIMTDRMGGTAEGKLNSGKLLFDMPRGQLEITYLTSSDGIDIGGQVYRRAK